MGGEGVRRGMNGSLGQGTLFAPLAGSFLGPPGVHLTQKKEGTKVFYLNKKKKNTSRWRMLILYQRALGLVDEDRKALPGLRQQVLARE